MSTFDATGDDDNAPGIRRLWRYLWTPDVNSSDDSELDLYLMCGELD